MFDSVFEALFKYPPWVFAQGDIRAASSPAAAAVAVVVAVCALLTLLSYRRAARLRLRDRVVLATIRLMALTLVLIALLRPVLAVRAAVSQPNVVAVLLDDSRSMRIADLAGTSRGSVVQREFGGPEAPILKALSSRYLVRLFRFSRSTERIADGRALDFSGTQTRVGEALQRVREELTGLPVAGLVVVSDGADTTSGSIAEPLLSLKAERLPVFTIGVGAEKPSRDIQIGRVVAPRAVLQGTAIVLDVPVDHRGFRGTTVPVTVESDGRMLATASAALGGDAEPATVRVRFTADDPGDHVFRFRVPVQAGETIQENNVREALVQVRDRREKILHFEGEPRFEAKFARNAVEADRNLQLVLLQRTAENKFLRLHVDTPNELAGGFPRTRDELFAYRGLILGSIEAAAFTADQLRMIAEFVDRRGGGLLMLGAPHAYAEGGYAGTPVADALPVVLEGRPRQAAELSLARLNIRPTRAGARHAVTQLWASERDAASRWRDLPQLTSVNVLRGIKPGATVLLTGTGDRPGEQVVLAYQRYGRGKTIALTVQDSWQWQLHSTMTVEDTTHETLWRQLLRWLVADTPDPVAITAAPDRVERGQTVTLTATVVDASYVEVNGAAVAATVTAPSGRATEVPLQWTGDRNGEYRASFVPGEDGVHEVKVAAANGGTPLGTATSAFHVAASDAEAFDAAMRAPLLRRIAEETGGRFYDVSTMERLPSDLKFAGRGVTTIEEHDLWDMPALFVLLVGCVLADWSYRRARGLA